MAVGPSASRLARRSISAGIFSTNEASDPWKAGRLVTQRRLRPSPSEALTEVPCADTYRAEGDQRGNPLEQTLVVVEKRLVPRHIHSGHDTEPLDQTAHDRDQGYKGDDVGDEIAGNRATTE